MSFISEHHQIKNWSKVLAAECIARNELLTYDVLIREIIKSNKDKSLKRSICKKIERQIRTVKSQYELEEREVIYIFLKLWYYGFVKKYNFIKALETTSNLRVSMWKREYYIRIQQIQEQFIIV